MRYRRLLLSGWSVVLLLVSAAAPADGIVSKIVNSPLSAAGLVSNGRTEINIYLQSAEHRSVLMPA